MLLMFRAQPLIVTLSVALAVVDCAPASDAITLAVRALAAIHVDRMVFMALLLDCIRHNKRSSPGDVPAIREPECSRVHPAQSWGRHWKFHLPFVARRE